MNNKLKCIHFFFSFSNKFQTFYRIFYVKITSLNLYNIFYFLIKLELKFIEFFLF